jgi:hypothetical protein
LRYLDDCEHFGFGGGTSDNLAGDLQRDAEALQMAINERRDVEDAASKWGYDAEAVPSKQR